jgi:hypothetical protein
LKVDSEKVVVAQIVVTEMAQGMNTRSFRLVVIIIIASTTIATTNLQDSSTITHRINGMIAIQDMITNIKIRRETNTIINIRTRLTTCTVIGEIVVAIMSKWRVASRAQQLSK